MIPDMIFRKWVIFFLQKKSPTDEVQNDHAYHDNQLDMSG